MESLPVSVQSCNDKGENAVKHFSRIFCLWRFSVAAKAASLLGVNSFYWVESK